MEATPKTDEIIFQIQRMSLLLYFTPAYIENIKSGKEDEAQNLVSNLKDCWENYKKCKIFPHDIYKEYYDNCPSPIYAQEYAHNMAARFEAIGMLDNYKDYYLDGDICKEIWGLCKSGKISESQASVINCHLDFIATDLTHWISGIHQNLKELGYKPERAIINKNNKPNNNTKQKEIESILERAVKAGLLDNNYMPINGTTQAQLKLLACYTSVELEIDTPWKTFGEFWGIKHLAQVNDTTTKEEKLNKVRRLFEKDVLKKAKDRFK